MHIAAYLKVLGKEERSAPTIKQHLKKGKTPVLNTDEARALLDKIDLASLPGLRDRALIGVMVYSFARISAVLEMKVKDYYVQARRGAARLGTSP